MGETQTGNLQRSESSHTGSRAAALAAVASASAGDSAPAWSVAACDTAAAGAVAITCVLASTPAAARSSSGNGCCKLRRSPLSPLSFSLGCLADGVGGSDGGCGDPTSKAMLVVVLMAVVLAVVLLLILVVAMTAKMLESILQSPLPPPKTVTAATDPRGCQ